MSLNLNMSMIAGNHFLNALGVDSSSMMMRLEVQAGQSGQSLSNLANGFATAAGMLPSALAQMLQLGNVPAAAAMPMVPWGACMCPNMYAQPQTIDFGDDGSKGFLGKFLARQKGARLERMLDRDPFKRAQAEMMLGGVILPDGSADGKLTIQPFATGYFPAGGAGNLAAAHAMAALNQVNQAASSGVGAMISGAASAAASAALGGFPGMVLNGLSSVLGSITGGGSSRGTSYTTDPYQQRTQQAFANGNDPFVAGGYVPASTTGNRTSGGSSTYADVAGTDTSSIAAVLADPSLTVEDQVVLMLMMIMKQMDKQIKEQAENVNKMQQKANKGDKQSDDAPSIDVETMKLKRMIDKRSQMFDMLRQIIDKYNQTAKSMIDSIGR